MGPTVTLIHSRCGAAQADLDRQLAEARTEVAAPLAPAAREEAGGEPSTRIFSGWEAVSELQRELAAAGLVAAALRGQLADAAAARAEAAGRVSELGTLVAEATARERELQVRRAECLC